MANIPDVVGGRYRIERRLGVGGMGELLLGRDPSLRRLVAIKLLREDLTEGEGSSLLATELRQRFVNEAKAAAGLNHPNIVVIHDVVDDPGGRPFIVMEYVQGRTLEALIGKEEPIDLATKLRLMEQLCDGLSCAHESELKIVHRDIKPANLMVDKQNNLKILDFGIARLADFELTRTGSQLGSPHYMAPEQFVGRGVDYRCDIWAAGVVFYEFLSYIQAFPGNDALERRIINQHPPALDSLPRCAGLDPRIVRVVNRAIEKEPGRRYKNLKVMGAEIQEIRLSLGASATTLTPSGGSTPRPFTPTPGGTPSRTPSVTPVQPTDPDDLAGLLEQRAAQIDTNLAVARQAVAASNFEAALRACNQVFFFDPKNPEAQALAGRARVSLDDQRIGEILTTAQAELARGQLDEAARLAGLAKALRPASTTVVKLLIAIDDARREDAERGARERAIDGYLVEAERALAQRDPQAALSAINQVLMLDRANLRGQSLQHEAYDLSAEQQREKELNDRAARAIESARARFAGGEPSVAIAMLEAFPTPTPSVSEALAALRADADASARREVEQATARVAAAREKFAAGMHQQAVADLEGVTPAHPLISAALIDFRLRAEEHERELDERASRAVAAARQTFERGRRQDAIAALADYTPAHATVGSALSELRARSADIERDLAERERLAEIERNLAERARAAEVERHLAERARAAEVERNQAERARLAEIERNLAERARAAEVERKQAERARAAEDSDKTWPAFTPPGARPAPQRRPNALPRPPEGVRKVSGGTGARKSSGPSRAKRLWITLIGAAVLVGVIALVLSIWKSSSGDGAQGSTSAAGKSLQPQPPEPPRPSEDEIRSQIERDLQAGRVAHGEGDWAAARAAYRRVLALEPGNKAATTGIEAANRAEQALKEYSKKP